MSTDFWRTLPVSFVGRIDAIKMFVLTHFLHFFQSIPCFNTQSYFKKLDSIIILFILNYKAIRISKKHLSKAKAASGFTLSDFTL